MKDILFHDDLEINDGDFIADSSAYQNTQHIILAQKGEYKEVPEIGVGIEQMLNHEESTEFLIEIKKNLEYDGQKVTNVSFTQNNKLSIDAKYITT